MIELTFSVPGTPPSVNMYRRQRHDGRHYKTDAAFDWDKKVHIAAERAFRAAGLELLQKVPVTGVERKKRKYRWMGTGVPGKAYLIKFHVYLAAKQRGDIDNFKKCGYDALVRAGVVKSDAMFHREETGLWRDPENPRTEYGIIAIQPQT